MKLPGFLRASFAAVFWLGFAAIIARAQTSLPHAQVGVAYSYTVTTTPAAPSGSVYGATGLPTGISVNSSSGVISGTPTTAGSYSGAISIAPPGSGTNNLSYVLVVDAALGAPAITSATTASTTVGQTFTYTVTASNSPTSFNLGTLPAGLSFSSSTNQITDNGGTMTAGTYTVSLSANNASGTGATTTLTITINPAGPVPVITSATSTAATAVPASSPASFTVNYQIVATNSPASYSASGLPLGVSVDTTTGLISGTTTIQGVYTIGLVATNNNGASATVNLTLTVGALPAITSASSLNASSSQAFAFTVTANNSAQSFNVSGLPTGLSVNTSTGVISGTVSTVGTYAVTVSANNSVGTGPTSTLTITVSAPAGGGGATSGTGAPIITSPNTATGIVDTAFTYSVLTTPAATSFALSGTYPANFSINASTGVISGTPAQTGVYPMTVTASNSGGSAIALVILTVNSRPVVTAQPQTANGQIGGSVVLSVTASGTPAPTYQWRKNGTAITGATSSSLLLGNFQISDAGSYAVDLTNVTGTVRSQSAAVGVVSTAKVAGAGTEVGANITHPNGNVYDQVLLTGSSASITADAGQVTRISFIDLNDDIVQVEFSGAGTLTLTLDNATGPAAPVKYNQPGVTYMKGHASLVITGANETSYLTVFSVGSITAVNQSLFPAGTTFDGLADIGLISIATTNGKFGAIRAANASFFRSSGLTGIYAPGVAVQGPSYIGDLTADADATGTLVFGSTTDVRITGGDLLQLNNRAVQIDGITQMTFTAGTKSGGQTLPVQANRARLEKNGVDVTSQVVR